MIASCIFQTLEAQKLISSIGRNNIVHCASLIHAYPIWTNPVLYNLNTMEFASPWQENNTSRLAGFSVQLTTLRSQVWESNSKPYSTPFKKNWHAKMEMNHQTYQIYHPTFWKKNTVLKKYLLLDPNCSPCTPDPAISNPSNRPSSFPASKMCWFP